MSIKRTLPVSSLFAGKGKVRELLRTRNWADCPLGHPQFWPLSLRTTVTNLLDCDFPMFVAWGPQRNLIYNEAYIPILGDRHPAALGRPLQGVWAEAWQEVKPLLDKAARGESSFFEDYSFEILRNGRMDRGWFTFSISPVRDDAGVVAGQLVIINECTERVLAAKRQSAGLYLVEQLRGLRDADEITSAASRLLGQQLGASRVFYADIDAHAGTYRVRPDWTDNTLPSMAGASGWIFDYGHKLIAEARAGRTSAIADVATDERTASCADAWLRLGIRSLLNIPLLKGGQLISTISVHRAMPYEWTREDIRFGEDTADYTWAAVERARAEKALREQTQAESNRIRELFELSPSSIAVLSGKEHVIELANEAYCRSVGHRDLIGKPVWEALPEVAGQGFDALLDEVYSTGEAFVGRGLKVSVQLDENAPLTERYVDVLYQPILGPKGVATGIFVQSNDVTEAYSAQTALQESQGRLREGMDAARMVVWDMYPDSGRVDLSSNAVEIFGGTWDSRASMLASVYPEDREKIHDAHRMAAEDGSNQYKVAFRFIRPDNGKTLWLESRGQFLFDHAGRVSLVKGVTIDISERKFAEEELLRADRQKDEFLAMLAHELRNPLAPISAAAQLMKIRQLDATQLADTADVISRQAGHLTSLVDDLLDVSRVRRGLVALNTIAGVDLKCIVANAIEQVGPLVHSRGHQLTTHLTQEQTLVLGDEKRLVQILCNVLNNAAKYTPDGGAIDLDLAVTEADVVIRVRDNGIGISPDLQPYIFDLFSQASRTSDRSQGGLGLGLALVKSLVMLHGGQVKVESCSAQKGSCFTLIFPRLAECGQTACTLSEPLAAPARTLRLMVVDDNKDAARTLAMLLETSGHQVRIVNDAQAALAEAAHGPFDACLLDIGLPGMDGNTLARRLREQPETANATLIAITGYGQATDRKKSQQAGFNYHFAKPVDVSALLDALAKI